VLMGAQACMNSFNPSTMRPIPEIGNDRPQTLPAPKERGSTKSRTLPPGPSKKSRTPMNLTSSGCTDMWGVASPPYPRRFAASRKPRADPLQASSSSGMREIGAGFGGSPRRWRTKWQLVFQKWPPSYGRLSQRTQL
jgi:hypothetical protein